MKDTIRVISLQFLPEKANIKANLNKIDELLEKSGEKSYDLILVPEFFNTGINLTNKQFTDYAEPEDASVSLDYFQRAAKKYNSYIVCGSFLVKKSDGVYNTSYVVDRNGTKAGEYSKIHLFDYFGGNEGAYTKPGKEITVLDTDFGKLGLGICFDLRFADHFTKLLKKGAEVITIPAAWSTLNSATPDFLDNFIDNWKLFARARALDNLACLVTSNICGKANHFLSSIGYSSIINFDGKVLKDALQDEYTSITAELNLKALREARKNFPIQKLTKID